MRDDIGKVIIMESYQVLKLCVRCHVKLFKQLISLGTEKLKHRELLEFTQLRGDRIDSTSGCRLHESMKSHHK